MLGARIDTAGTLSLRTSTSYLHVLSMAVSDVNDFAASRAMEVMASDMEARNQALDAVLKHINGVIKGIGNLIKSLPSQR